MKTHYFFSAIFDSDEWLKHDKVKITEEEALSVLLIEIRKLINMGISLISMISMKKKERNISRNYPLLD